jgi:phosphoribosylanthranilate isomerase
MQDAHEDSPRSRDPPAELEAAPAIRHGAPPALPAEIPRWRSRSVESRGRRTPPRPPGSAPRWWAASWPGTRPGFLAAGRRTTPVAVLRAPLARDLVELARASGARAIQASFAGPAELALVEKAGLVAWRVVEVPTGSGLLPLIQPEPTATRPALLQSAAAGTGLTFPWELLGASAPPHTLISGGVRPENVCALLTHEPAGINVCSGVELSVGIKSPERMALLFDLIRSSRAR